MGKKTLDNEGKEIIDSMLGAVRPDPETLGLAAAEILSQLTGLTTVSASGLRREARLKKAGILPMGRGSAVVFAISDDGRTRSRLVRLSGALNTRIIEMFENIVATKVCSVDITLLDMAYLQSIVVSAGLEALTLAPLLSCVFDLASEFKTASVNMGGTAHLFSVCPTDSGVKRILDLLRTGDAVYSIFSTVNDPVGVVFGRDTEYSELAPAGMVVASYGDSGNLGRIAVIGPTRMAYENILPSAEYLAQRVGSIMTEVLKGLED
jgi:heat-inducible transcriptional repressor